MLDSPKSILLNVPLRLFQRLNEASAAMAISRSELIRRSLSRDLEFVLDYEVALIARFRADAGRDYALWAKKHR